MGVGALQNNRASNNTAMGTNALFGNTGGIQNTATGFSALVGNTTGGHNTADGFNALAGNRTGNNNTAVGQGALAKNTTGSNTADGQGALSHLTTGSGNIALGFSAGVNVTFGSYNIDIGSAGTVADANLIRIGTKGTHNGTFIAGIAGVPVSGTQVVVDSSGKLGVAASSARFKEAVKPMDKGSETIFQLKPVNFRYKSDLDPDGIPQFGLVAEEVEKINPDLVSRDEDGKVMTVRYEAVNAMLLNEFLKEHRSVAEQRSTIAELKTTVAKQQKQIEALTATLRKVSERLELSAPATQIAANED